MRRGLQPVAHHILHQGVHLVGHRHRVRPHLPVFAEPALLLQGVQAGLQVVFFGQHGLQVLQGNLLRRQQGEGAQQPLLRLPQRLRLEQVADVGLEGGGALAVGQRRVQANFNAALQGFVLVGAGQQAFMQLYQGQVRLGAGFGQEFGEPGVVIDMLQQGLQVRAILKRRGGWVTGVVFQEQLPGRRWLQVIQGQGVEIVRVGAGGDEHAPTGGQAAQVVFQVIQFIGVVGVVQHQQIGAVHPGQGAQHRLALRLRLGVGGQIHLQGCGQLLHQALPQVAVHGYPGAMVVLLAAIRAVHIGQSHAGLADAADAVHQQEHAAVVQAPVQLAQGIFAANKKRRLWRQVELQGLRPGGFFNIL